jgi:betaine-aldehyde dehydrogenase
MSTTSSTIAGVQVPAVPTQLYIDGTWQDAAEGGTFTVIAPTTEERIVDVAAATAADVDRAVRAARAQIDGGAWSRMSGADRGVLLHRLADAIERDAETFVTLEALDIGRPAFEPRAVDIPNTIDVYRHFAGWADKIDGRALTPPPAFGRERFAYTRREPVGVVGAIVAWNAPTMIASWKLAPALAAGNAVVLKPAEDACLTALYLAQLADEVGFPAGVLNVLPGLGVDAGAPLVSHPGVDKISFTGSPEVGRGIGVQCAEDMRRVTLELGGKSPQVILPGADLSAVIPGVAGGFLANQGEICAAGTRIFAAREVFDDVVAGLAEAANGVTLGDPFDEATTMGALINRKQFDRVNGYIAAGQDEGAELAAGGGGLDRDGFFVRPTVFAAREGGGNDLRIAREEIFGPVGLVIPFDDVDDAVRQANDTAYGLGAYLWTGDLAVAHQVAARLRAGSVWINGPGAPDARLPWGGMKTSGIGRELGFAGIEANTEEKTVVISF